MLVYSVKLESAANGLVMPTTTIHAYSKGIETARKQAAEQHHKTTDELKQKNLAGASEEWRGLMSTIRLGEITDEKLAKIRLLDLINDVELRVGFIKPLLTLIRSNPRADMNNYLQYDKAARKQLTKLTRMLAAVAATGERTWQTGFMLDKVKNSSHHTLDYLCQHIRLGDHPIYFSIHL